MPASTIRKAATQKKQTTGYRGKQTKTGNSSGFRFESALFRSHPEFNGEVTAHVIAPGRMLVTADVEEEEEEADPVLASFLALLAQDIAQFPEKLRPLDESFMERIDKLVGGMKIDPNEDLGEEDLLS